MQGGEVTLPPKREVFYLSQRPYLVAGRQESVDCVHSSYLCTSTVNMNFDLLILNQTLVNRFAQPATLG